MPDALMGLVGDWNGDGVGADPGRPDFRFGHQLTVTHVGPTTLAHVSRSWALDPIDETEPEAADAAGKGADPAVAVMTESGFWRWDAESGTVELVLASASGVVTVCYGEVRPDPAGEGAHVELATDVVGRTATAQPVTAEKRLYSRRGDVLLYAVDQALLDRPLAPRASAALHPVGGGRRERSGTG